MNVDVGCLEDPREVFLFNFLIIISDKQIIYYNLKKTDQLSFKNIYIFIFLELGNSSFSGTHAFLRD